MFLQVVVTESYTLARWAPRLNLPEVAYTVPPIYVYSKCLQAYLEPVWSDGAIRVKKFWILYECYILKIIGHETCKTTMIIMIISSVWWNISFYITYMLPEQNVTVKNHKLWGPLITLRWGGSGGDGEEGVQDTLLTRPCKEKEQINLLVSLQLNNSDKKIMTYRLKKFNNNDTTQTKIFSSVTFLNISVPPCLQLQSRL